MATFNFNAASVIPAAPRAFEPLPAGDYELVVTGSDVKQTKQGNGHYIELEMQVISGEFSGRRIWERLNIDNPNKQAEDIAKGALAALCGAVGIVDMTDTAQLHDVPFQARIEIDRKDATRNRVMGYLSGAKPAPKAAPSPAPAPAFANKKPWQ